MSALNFYFNDLYPNQGVNNTRLQTIPEAEDRKAVGEESKAVENAKVTPTKKKSVFIALAVIVAFIVIMGVSK